MVSLLMLASCSDQNLKRLYFTIDKKQMTLGQVDTLELFFDPVEATNYNLITWTSSDQSVVQVSPMGEVRAVYSGKSIVTASYRDVKAQVEITVSPISFEMSFSKAVAYFTGSSVENSGIGECLLRFLSDGYEVGLDGSISGAGYYINMLLYVDRDWQELYEWDFYPSDNVENGKYRKGYFFEKNNAVYVSGSFLGHTSIGSSSATAIEGGVMSLKKIGERYLVSATFTGDRQETMRVSYNGDIEFFDLTLPPQDTLSFYETESIISLGDKYDNGTTVFRVALKGDSYNELQLDFVTPLSAESLPFGQYRLSNKIEPFSLIAFDGDSSDGALLFSEGEAIGIISGEVWVKRDSQGKNKFDIFLHTSNGYILTD